MSIFDLNQDGEVDLGETLLGFSLSMALADELDREVARDKAAEELDEKIEALQVELRELEDQLSDLESREPDDILSAAYDCWENRRQTLEEQIADIEDEIETLLYEY